jgi:hypothetical protein
MIDYKKRTKTFTTERRAIRREKGQTAEHWKAERENLVYISLAE